MAEDWDKLRVEITKEFKEYGADSFVIETTHGEYDISTGTNSSTETKHVAYCLISSKESADNDIIMSENLQARISAPPTLTLTSKQNLKLELNNQIYTIKKIKPVMPGGIVLYYRIEAEVYDE